MYIPHANSFEGTSIHSGDIESINQSVVLKSEMVGAVMSAGTTINAGTKSGLWNLEGFSDGYVI